MNIEEIEKFIRDTVINFFKQNSLAKYRDKIERKENDIFVSDILRWYFSFSNNVNWDEPQGYIVVGDAIDDYVKKAFNSKDRKLILDIGEFRLIGDPDIVLSLDKLSLDNTLLVIEVKFSDSIKEYHILQTLMYIYMLKQIEKKNVVGSILAIRNDIKVKVIIPTEEQLNFIENIIKAYIDYMRLRKDGITRIISLSS